MFKLFLIVLVGILSVCSYGGFAFHATDNVDALYRYGLEWYDSSGNIQAWSYFEIANTPWSPAEQYSARWAGRACCGFDVSEVAYDPTDPIEFTWPVELISVPDIDPAWIVVQINALWAYDYPDYLINDGWPVYLYDYIGGDIWVDAQNGVILEAFGSQPDWWPEPVSALKHGKKLGHAK